MKLFTNEQIRAIERHTIETEGIPPGEIIERVAEGVADEIAARWRPSKPTIVFAGPGNTEPTRWPRPVFSMTMGSTRRYTSSTSAVTSFQGNAHPCATACSRLSLTRISTR